MEKRMVNFVLRFFYAWERDPVPIKQKVVGVACFGKEKKIVSSGNRTAIPRSPSPQLSRFT